MNTYILYVHARWIHSIQRVLDVVIHAHIHRLVLDNDALDCEESALLHHERASAKKRAVEIQRIKQTAASRAAIEASKKSTKKKRKSSKTCPDSASAQSPGGKWWESAKPMGETFLLTSTENEDKVIKASEREKMSFQARVFVDNIIHSGSEKVIRLVGEGKVSY
jgi:hypothetical protein